MKIFINNTSHFESGNNKEIESFYTAAKIQPILATKSFIRTLDISECERSEITKLESKNVKLTLDDALQIVAKVTNKTSSEILISKRGHRNVARSLYVYICRKVLGYPLSEIASYLTNCHYSTLSSIVTSFEKHMLISQDAESLLKICLLEVNNKHQPNPS